jgi:hypothetical protein
VRAIFFSPLSTGLFRPFHPSVSLSTFSPSLALYATNYPVRHHTPALVSLTMFAVRDFPITKVSDADVRAALPVWQTFSKVSEYMYYKQSLYSTFENECRCESG